jgi:hypothetical protein
MEEEPLELYQQQVQQGIFSPIPYDRLMIHYRKAKDYDAELKVIKKGIDVFKKFYAGVQGANAKRKRSKIAELSKKISKSTGLTDKKGNDVYLPEPLPRWIKRQAVVEEKIKKAKAK